MCVCQRLHERFSELIEGIVTDYLLQEGYTLETFYEEVKACKEKKGSDEVSDVLWLVGPSVRDALCVAAAAAVVSWAYTMVWFARWWTSENGRGK